MPAKKREPWFCQDCRIAMKYIEKDDFYKCPACGNELWPADTYKPTDEIGTLMQDFAPTHKPNEYLPAGGPLLGGGSSNNSVKKPKSKKLSLAQLNFKLHNEV